MVEVKLLRKFEVFNGLETCQLEEIAKITEALSFKASERVYNSGDPAKYLYIVQKGLVSLRELKPGDNIGVGFESLEDGDIFGCGSLIKPQRYTLTAVCKEDTKVLELAADRLLECCEVDPELGYRLMKKIAKIYMNRFETARRQIHEMVKIPAIITALPG